MPTPTIPTILAERTPIPRLVGQETSFNLACERFAGWLRGNSNREKSHLLTVRTIGKVHTNCIDALFHQEGVEDPHIVTAGVDKADTSQLRAVLTAASNQLGRRIIAILISESSFAVVHVKQPRSQKPPAVFMAAHSQRLGSWRSVSLRISSNAAHSPPTLEPVQYKTQTHSFVSSIDLNCLYGHSLSRNIPRTRSWSEDQVAQQLPSLRPPAYELNRLSIARHSTTRAFHILADMGRIQMCTCEFVVSGQDTITFNTNDLWWAHSKMNISSCRAVVAHAHDWSLAVLSVPADDRLDVLVNSRYASKTVFYVIQEMRKLQLLTQERRYTIVSTHDVAQEVVDRILLPSDRLVKLPMIALTPLTLSARVQIAKLVNDDSTLLKELDDTGSWLVPAKIEVIADDSSEEDDLQVVKVIILTPASRRSSSRFGEYTCGDMGACFVSHSPRNTCAFFTQQNVVVSRSSDEVSIRQSINEFIASRFRSSRPELATRRWSWNLKRENDLSIWPSVNIARIHHDPSLSLRNQRQLHLSEAVHRLITAPAHRSSRTSTLPVRK